MEPFSPFSQSLVSCQVGAFLLCFFELLTGWILERNAFNKLVGALQSSPQLALSALICPFCSPARKGVERVRENACVRVHNSLSVCIIRFPKHMEWDLSQGDSFVKVSTHGKSISVLSLLTEIVFVLWGQKKFKSWDMVVLCLCIYLPFLFELSQAAAPVQRSLSFHPFWKAAQPHWLIRMYLMKRLRE